MHQGFFLNTIINIFVFYIIVVTDFGGNYNWVLLNIAWGRSSPLPALRWNFGRSYIHILNSAPSFMVKGDDRPGDV